MKRIRDNLLFPNFMPKIRVTIETPTTFSMDPRLHCCPCTPGQLRKMNLSNLLEPTTTTRSSFTHPETKNRVSRHKVIALGNTPVNLMDVSLEASHQCHTMNCIIPQHINTLDHKGNLGCNVCNKEAASMRERGVMIPLHCTRHNPPCRLASAAITTQEHKLASWMYFHGYPSLDAVPEGLLPDISCTSEFMDASMQVYQVVEVDGVLKARPMHELTLRSYIQNRTRSGVRAPARGASSGSSVTRSADSNAVINPAHLLPAPPSRHAGLGAVSTEHLPREPTPGFVTEISDDEEAVTDSSSLSMSDASEDEEFSANSTLPIQSEEEMD